MQLTRMAQIVKEAALPEDADLAKSMYGLVKANKGFFKSEKQGMFLLKEFDRRHKFFKDAANTKLAWQWAKGLKDPDPQTTIAGVLEYNMAGFGIKDPTKIRRAVVFYLVDSSGVVALAKAKVGHPRKDDPRQNYPILPGSIQEIFVRPADAVAPLVVPYFAKIREQEQKLNKQIQDNQELINRIRAIPNYMDQEILLSFIDQLNGGRTLSPKQMQIVNRYLEPQEQQDLGMGTPAEWKQLIVDFMEETEKQIIPAFKEKYLAIGMDDTPPRLDKEWADFKANPTVNAGFVWTLHLIGNLLYKLVPGREMVELSQDIPDAVNDVYKAINLPPKKKITKKSVKNIMSFRRLVALLKTHPAAKIKSAVEATS